MDYLELSNFFFKKYKSFQLNRPLYLKKELIHDFVNNILKIVFPITYKYNFKNHVDLSTSIKNEEIRLLEILSQIMEAERAKKLTFGFFGQLKEIHDLLEYDAELWAISVHRIAHYFYSNNVPIFPRFLSEYAHQLTGIDIHPGAKIGKSFSIDHGTGVVIGETTIIGNNVKIYQGVTLGALSPEKYNSNIKAKRHPTIEDGCIVYSNATILGGETLIGSNSVIGGNVWIIKSIPKNSLVFHKSEIRIIDKKFP